MSLSNQSNSSARMTDGHPVAVRKVAQSLPLESAFAIWPPRMIIFITLHQ